MALDKIHLGVVPQLPDEILEEIFVRLPLKTLVIQTAVCKLWNSLIKSSVFIQAHRERNQHNNLLLTQAKTAVRVRGKEDSRFLFYVHRDKPPFHPYKCYYKQITHPFVAYNRLCVTSRKDRLSISRNHEIQTCNGLVCISDGYLRVFNYTALLWNPCIRKFVTLPSLRDNPDDYKVGRISYGLGYDSSTDDYKVVRIVIYRAALARKTSYEIWSLKQPSWRSLSVLPPVQGFDPCRRATVFVCGAVHWVHRPNEGSGRNGPIVSFDMSNEVFGEISIPEIMRSKHKMDISNYRNSLATLIWEKDYVVDMWVMKEYGVVESWTKLITVQLPIDFRPVGFRNSGEAVLKYFYASHCVQLNPDRDDNNIGDFEAKGGKFSEYFFVEPFVESLVLLNHPSAISTSLKLTKNKKIPAI